MLQIGSGACLLWAILILTLPAKWLLCAILAALIHEFCHGAAVLIVGGRIRRVWLGPFGAVMDTEEISGLREAVCALAGPVGSLLLAGWIHNFPILGLCGLIQGCFNLLPVYPLDGGRVLQRLLEHFDPEKAGSICRKVSAVVFSLLLCTAIYLFIVSSIGILPFALCIMAIARALLRKKP